MRHSIAEFSREHKWEIILGLVFAVLFGVAWEVGKHTLEHASHVPPDRLAAGTVRVALTIILEDDAQRKAVAEWQKTHPAVIATEFAAFLKMGSGFAVSDEGWIVTARHVVSTTSLAPLLEATGATPFVIVNYPPGTERRAAVVDQDSATDTAILKTSNAPPERYLVIGDPEEVHRLDHVLAAGYPSAADFASVMEPTLTAGEISKVGEEEPIGKVFQTTAPIGPGNSGGPLLDAEGRVIGVNIGVPPNRDLSIGFAVSIERAKRMLAARGAALPSSYEHQGILRQPWFVWVASLSLVALLLGYFGVALRSLWRRRFKNESDPPYADFWIRFVALLIDAGVTTLVSLVLIVLAILASGSFLPWYRLVAALPLAWLAYAAICEWRWSATIGKRIAGLRVRDQDGGALSPGRSLLRSAAHVVSALPLAIGFLASAFDARRRTWHDRIAGAEVVASHKRSPWAMFAIGAVVFIVTFLAVAGHWVLLANRARTDLQQVHSRLWSGGETPAPEMARMMAKAADRAAFFEWVPLKPEPGVFYDYGLDWMLAGSPRRAIDAFRRAAGAPWDAFEPGSGHAHTSDAWAAVAKTGWCYFDLGDDAGARRMFQLAGSARDLDVLLGLGATVLRSGEGDAARAACRRARSADAKGVERLVRSDSRVQVGHPFYLTRSQLRAAQELLAVCGEQQTELTTPASP